MAKHRIDINAGEAYKDYDDFEPANEVAIAGIGQEVAPKNRNRVARSSVAP
jgi:hypothetical protein